MKKLLMILLSFIAVHSFSQENLFEINITHDNPEKGLIHKGMPLVLHIAIQSPHRFTLQEMEAGFDDSIPMNPKDRKWLDSLYAPVKIVDSPAVWYSCFILDIQSEGQKRFLIPEPIVLNPPPAEVSWLYPDRPMHLYLGFDPKETSQWKTGKMGFKAGIIRSLDTLWSKPLSISVSQTSAAKIKNMKVEELVYVGEYFLRSDRCEKAAPYAKAIADIGAPDFVSTLFLGAYYECIGDTATALRRYNDAYYLYYSQKAEHLEPPFHLMKKIGELQRQFLVPDEEP